MTEKTTLSRISDLLRCKEELDNLKKNKFCIDGGIIGTGESDFTKGNVQYHFKIQNKDLTIIDVPGIEGHESKFENYVKEAVAKAHVVFYVNGTNKKPEVNTANKIKGYLRNDSFVYAICNVRGKADSYEFDEDRINLEETHRNSVAAKEQTYDVLKRILGDKLHDICNVQGLLAFSSLAKGVDNETTIAEERSHDLGRSQKSYLRYFKDYTTMKKFSQIDNILDYINGKASSFEDDIVESNKNKIINRLNQSIEDISSLKKAHSELCIRFDEEVKIYLKRIEVHQQDFGKNIQNRLPIIVDEILMEFQNNIIEEFDKKPFNLEVIDKNIEGLYKVMQRNLGDRINQECKNLFNLLEAEINKSLEWLQSDMQSFSKYKELEHVEIDTGIFIHAIDDMKLNFKDYLTYAFDVGQFVFDAVALATQSGNPFVIVGAGIAAFLYKLGIVVKDVTIGRKREIRNKVRKSLDQEMVGIRNNYCTELEKIIKNGKQSVDGFIQKSIVERLNYEVENLKLVECLLMSQISEIVDVREELKEKAYGAI